MAEPIKTPNYGFTKWGDNLVDPADVDNNFDLVDASLGSLNEKLENLDASKIALNNPDFPDAATVDEGLSWLASEGVDGSVVNVLTENKTVYVSVSGNDTTGNGNSESPWRTIMKAVNNCPKNLNGFNYTINLAAGTYGEDIAIEYFYGSSRIEIVGSASTPSNYIINSATITNCRCIARLTGMHFTNPNKQMSITIEGCSDARVADCTINNISTSNGRSGILARAASVAVVNCTISNSISCIIAQSSHSGTGGNFPTAIVSVRNTTGSGNGIFLESQGGIILAGENNTVTATTMYSCGRGGILSKPSGVMLGS